MLYTKSQKTQQSLRDVICQAKVGENVLDILYSTVQQLIDDEM
jgi:hypothetical protein